MREQTRGCIDPANKTDGILIMPILSDAILYTGAKPVRLKGDITLDEPKELLAWIDDEI